MTRLKAETIDKLTAPDVRKVGRGEQDEVFAKARSRWCGVRFSVELGLLDDTRIPRVRLYEGSAKLSGFVKFQLCLDRV